MELRINDGYMDENDGEVIIIYEIFDRRAKFKVINNKGQAYSIDKNGYTTWDYGNLLSYIGRYFKRRLSEDEVMVWLI